MTTATTGIGLKRLQHLVLWVSDVERSVRFYRDVLGFEVKTRYPNAAFLKIPETPDDHHLGLFEQTGVSGPDERVARMYHAAWEVGEITDLVRARQRLVDFHDAWVGAPPMATSPTFSDTLLRSRLENNVVNPRSSAGFAGAIDPWGVGLGRGRRGPLPLSSAGFAGATIPAGRLRKGGEAPLRVELAQRGITVP